ncbi:unnamed protein product [Acanthoscelides obtectus]|uniref:Uncharacterized protein n=1 Tax=Acanthoscelides obtectus TaxID=200917 RepID=A0A9P0JZW3_ACAOB|nr:unnamed protein product [Acanthoscelides obtectus]CAK1631527.1 hypothetical protein AOBTE_LOCUS6993 [Acanthoscelides obtectus]
MIYVLVLPLNFSRLHSNVLPTIWSATTRIWSPTRGSLSASPLSTTTLWTPSRTVSTRAWALSSGTIQSGALSTTPGAVPAGALPASRTAAVLSSTTTR